jgi:hypothetical protein
VLADVVAGVVSPGRAQEDYGVVVHETEDGFCLDTAATTAEREQR